jgi:hypothetical protein
MFIQLDILELSYRVTIQFCTIIHFSGSYILSFFKIIKMCVKQLKL